MSEQLYYRIQIKDKNDKIVKKGRLRKCHSYVLQYLQFQEIYTAHAYGTAPDSITMKDVTNTNQTMPNAGQNYISWNSMATEAPAGNTDYGIQAGTGQTAPTNTDYAMQTKIAHGTGSGQLSYGATSVANAGVSGSNVDLISTRAFVNTSGATITIYEIGLACESQNSSAQAKYFLLIRDAVNQAVENGQTATVTIIRRTTV